MNGGIYSKLVLPAKRYRQVNTWPSLTVSNSVHLRILEINMLALLKFVTP